jgi:hypothetical protein
MPTWKTNLLALLIVIGLTACNGGASQPESATQAIEAYLQALVEHNGDRASTLSCAAFEPTARQEYESFAEVTARLEEPNCQESGEADGFTLVSCTGSIVANYFGEDQEINLGDRIYQAIQEGGEWRMCGYR